MIFPQVWHKGYLYISTLLHYSRRTFIYCVMIMTSFVGSEITGFFSSCYFRTVMNDIFDIDALTNYSLKHHCVDVNIVKISYFTKLFRFVKQDSVNHVRLRIAALLQCVQPTEVWSVCSLSVSVISNKINMCVFCLTTGKTGSQF